MQNSKDERDVQNRADWGKSMKETNIRIGL